MTTELQQIEQAPEGALVCLPVADLDALTALVRDLATLEWEEDPWGGMWCRCCGFPQKDGWCHAEGCLLARADAVVARWDAAEPVQS